MTNSPLNTKTLLFKLKDLLFTNEAEQFIKIINKVEADTNFKLGMSIEEYRKLTDEEKIAIFNKIADDTNKKNKESKIDFTLDNKHYELRFDNQENSIYLAYYKNDSNFCKQDALNEKVSNNIDTFKEKLIKISETYPLIQFSKVDSVYEPFYRNIIASRNHQSVSIYLGDEALILFSKLKTLFTMEEQNFIDSLISIKFEKHTNYFENQMIDFFVEWNKKLKEESYTEDNKLEFNDLDNHAYIFGNDDLVMIVQESQNTIFSYIFNKKTNQIKVWNCSMVSTEDLDYYMNSYETYLEIMNVLGDPYGYHVFPIEMSGKDYPKSAKYYLDHFDDESEFLVFDSKKGFRVNTYFSNCMATDVPLLISVLKDL